MSLGIFSVAPPDGTMCPGVDSAPENEYHLGLLRDDLYFYYPVSALTHWSDKDANCALSEVRTDGLCIIYINVSLWGILIIISFII